MQAHPSIHPSINHYLMQVEYDQVCSMQLMMRMVWMVLLLSHRWFHPFVVVVVVVAALVVVLVDHPHPITMVVVVDRCS